jgi:hypothetical protein
MITSGGKRQSVDASLTALSDTPARTAVSLVNES